MRRFKYFDSSPDPEITILPPDEIFSAENIGPGGFELVELTRNTDNYRGHHYITSGFAMVEVPILDYAIVSAGLRVEDSDQEVNTFELFGEGQTTSKLSEVDTLGAMAVTIFLNESMQIRAGLGQTVNRPNLRELSPNAFDNYETGFTERGPDPATDPMLLRAKLMNLDLRWEWYLNLDEWITVGGFYKDFLNPIEDVEVPGATPQKTFINAAGATNVGVEVEGRKGLGFFSKMLRDFYITANVAFIDSQISIDTTGPTIIDVTNPERQLQGQSPYMLNIQLEYDNPETDTTVAILYNSYGRRITGAGATGIDDQYEEPVHLIDIVGSQTLGAGFKLKLKAQNILNATYRQTKGGQDVTTLQKGAKVGLGLSYSF